MATEKASTATLRTATIPASEVKQNEFIVVAGEVYRVTEVSGCGTCGHYDCICGARARARKPRLNAHRIIRLDANTRLEVTLTREINCNDAIDVVVDDTYEPTS